MHIKHHALARTHARTHARTNTYTHTATHLRQRRLTHSLVPAGAAAGRRGQGKVGDARLQPGVERLAQPRPDITGRLGGGGGTAAAVRKLEESAAIGHLGSKGRDGGA